MGRYGESSFRTTALSHDLRLAGCRILQFWLNEDSWIITLTVRTGAANGIGWPTIFCSVPAFHREDAKSISDLVAGAKFVCFRKRRFFAGYQFFIETQLNSFLDQMIPKLFSCFELGNPWILWFIFTGAHFAMQL